jgi:FkbM family methyltransferase
MFLNKVEGAVCWDLGAHFGVHAIGLAFHVGTSGEIVAVEPDHVAYDRLKYHVQLNRLNNVKLFQLAASNLDGDIELIIAQGLGSSVTHAKYEDEILTGETEIFSSKAARMDTLREKHQLRLPNLIKVDVEGHGAKALAGAMNTISDSKPIVVLSVHSPSEWQDSRSLLEPLGYRPVTRDGTKLSWEIQPGLATVLLNWFAA